MLFNVYVSIWQVLFSTESPVTEVKKLRTAEKLYVIAYIENKPSYVLNPGQDGRDLFRSIVLNERVDWEGCLDTWLLAVNSDPRPTTSSAGSTSCNEDDAQTTEHGIDAAASKPVDEGKTEAEEEDENGTKGKETEESKDTESSKRQRKKRRFKAPTNKDTIARMQRKVEIAPPPTPPAEGCGFYGTPCRSPPPTTNT